jgi:hypothetical protein
MNRKKTNYRKGDKVRKRQIAEGKSCKEHVENILTRKAN